MNTIIRICNEVSGLEGCPLAEMTFQHYLLLIKNKHFRMIIFSRPFSKQTLKKRKCKNSFEVLESLLHDKSWYGNFTNNKIIENLRKDVYFVDFNLIEKICYFFIRKSILRKAVYVVFSLSYHVRIAFHLRKLNIKNAVVHLFNRPLALLFKILVSDYKYVVEVGNSVFVKKKWFMQKVTNFFVSFFDGLLFISKFLKDEYMARNKRAPKQYIAYIGLSTLYLDLNNNLKSVIDKPLKISKWKAQFFDRHLFFKIDNNIRIVFVGRIMPQKGIDVLLDALGILINDKEVQDIIHQNESQIEVVLVGALFYGKQSSSPYARQVSKKIRGFSKDHLLITFKGFLDRVNLSLEYIRSDIIVVPCVWEEPYGLVNLEGMFFYDIDIASRSGAIPEIISHSKDGYLFKKGSSIELAATLKTTVKKILNKDNFLKELVKNAHKKIIQKFPMSNYIRDLNKAYRDIINNN